MAIETAVLMLMALGVVFVFSAGAGVRTEYELRHFYKYTVFKQFVFFPAAVAMMYLVSLIDYRRLGFGSGNPFKSPALYLLIISVVLLVLVLIPGIGTEKNSARRWLMIPLGPAAISFQPSELAKWNLIVFISAFCARYKELLKSYLTGFLPLTALIAGVVMLIITQDFGTAVFIAAVAAFVVFISASVWWHFLMPLPILIPAGLWLFLTAPNPIINTTRINRLKVFAAMVLPDVFPHIDASAYPANYQAKQSLLAVCGGGLLGRGLGSGISKYGHLPEDTTDFIFAIICEELGAAGAIAVLFLFLVILLAGMQAFYRSRDEFGRILSAGIITAICLQAAVNIGVVTVVLPTKGIPLPFVSAGGSSLLLTSAAAGILINIARQGGEPGERLDRE